VTDEESCRNAVARTVELFGALHILVNIGECQIYRSHSNCPEIPKRFPFGNWRHCR
jgi:hypothetical protein